MSKVKLHYKKTLNYMRIFLGINMKIHRKLIQFSCSGGNPKFLQWQKSNFK